VSIPNQLSRRLVLMTLAALVSAAAWGQSLNPAQFLPLSASIVRVEADRAQGGLSVGSGVTVAPSVVATNCHVVRDAIGIRIASSGATWNVDGEYADTRRDLCFLRVPAWGGTVVALAKSNVLRLGASVVALGFTGGVAIAPRFGRIRGLHAFDDGRIIESDAPFNSGSSGGGLFDAGGALIGLLTFRLRNSVDSYYSVPVQWIRERLPAEHQWTSVEPLKGASPFWQGEGEELPYFMRAAALEDLVPAQLSLANDFPTQARVEFVLACMRENQAIAQEAIYKCSCAIDAIATLVNYDTWVDLSTIANATTIAGERGGVMRDMKDGRKMIARFREIQDNAKKGCFLEK
jgi:Trypsin-like peptidase domain